MEKRELKIQKIYYYFRENALQSIISDVVTFSLLGVLLTFNHFILNDSIIAGIAIFISFILFVTASASSNKTFITKEDLLIFILRKEFGLDIEEALDIFWKTVKKDIPASETTATRTLKVQSEKKQNKPFGLKNKKSEKKAKKPSKVAGFTLIELLVVIAIIGILFSLMIASYKQAVQKKCEKQGTCTTQQTGREERVSEDVCKKIIRPEYHSQLCS